MHSTRHCSNGDGLPSRNNGRELPVLDYIVTIACRSDPSLMAPRACTMLQPRRTAMLIILMRVCVFDTVLTFLALRWSLDMRGQETFSMLFSLKRSR